MAETKEFSFILKSSAHGIGVFTIESIPQGTYLRLFGDRNKEGTLETRSRTLPKSQVPEEFWDYCMHRGRDELICPPDFGEMSVGWYLNHSTSPNSTRDDNYRWYAKRDIAAGEEITIDYNSLEEPECTKEKWYFR